MLQDFVVLRLKKTHKLLNGQLPKSVLHTFTECVVLVRCESLKFNSTASGFVVSKSLHELSSVGGNQLRGYLEWMGFCRRDSLWLAP